MAKTFVQTELFTELYHPRPCVDFSKFQSMTRQEFADEANVNNILKRYATTGVFYDPLTTVKASRKPLFGDFTRFKDFQSAQDAIIEAREAFDALPVEIREKFNYDPVKLVDWLQDPSNREEAIKLGFIEKAAEAAKPEPQKAAEAAEAAVEDPVKEPVK